jgi:glutamine amidotransferase
MKVVIVDYGMGNIKSVAGALQFIGINNITISASYEELKSADKLILPGVGSFGNAMNNIKEKKLDVYMHELVIEQKKSILGICLGMQLMGTSSTEEEYNLGLGYVNAEVRKFDSGLGIKIPHVGFNQIRVNTNTKLYKGLGDNLDFYFTHSFRMMSNEDIAQSICNYGSDFIASFEIGNIAGVQFHPELSQHHGLNLLRNFLNKF